MWRNKTHKGIKKERRRLSELKEIFLNTHSQLIMFLIELDLRFLQNDFELN
jgi:hypothetical protein